MDSILLFPPGASGVTGVGSAIQLGSWLHAEVGADYGAAGLIQSVQAQNSLRDGGVFAYRHAPVRHMAIPLIINTPSVVQWEGMLARYTTPGAYIAVQPEGIPSSQAVYFDVIDGRWEPAFNTFENRAHVRRGMLHLDTQPWGYWPTEILLASAASIGFIGQLAVNGASLIGDVPPLAHLTVMPTAASQYFAAGNGHWFTDMVALSFSARPSFNPFIPAAAFTGATYSAGIPTIFNYQPSLTGDAFAPASQALFYAPSQSNGASAGIWLNLAVSASAVSTALEPAYRGRFRVFSFVKSTPVFPFYAIVDAARGPSSILPALASGNQIATGGIPTSVFNNVLASPGYQTLDMGELTLPPGGSGIQGGDTLRLWFFAPSTPSGANFFFGGLYLLPVDGAAGILTRGMCAPSIGGNVGTQGGLELNANALESVNLIGQFSPSAPLPAPVLPPVDARTYYRGLPLRLGATTSSLVFLTGDRLFGATSPVAQANVEYAQVSVSYRPAFQFLYGI